MKRKQPIRYTIVVLSDGETWGEAKHASRLIVDRAGWALLTEQGIYPKDLPSSVLLSASPLTVKE